MRPLLKRVNLLPVLLFLVPALSLAQEKTVTGTILSEDDNTPLQGVTVTNRNNNQRTQTNKAGYYSITADKGHVLIFTYIGYVRQEVAVGDDRFVNLKLTPGDQQIGEVVVTAYGIKREKKTLAFSTTEVKGEEIAATRRDNFINSLAGRVPGATITATSGAPGASTTIILRGGTSVSLSNQPLFVIDGVPLDNGSLNQDPQRDNLLTRSTANRSDDFANRASDINPEDIESITVLKGPEAQALYGTDAANGAIVITTKKGKAGKATVTYGATIRIEQLYRFHETQKVYGRGRNGLPNLNETNAAFGEAATISPFYFGPKYADTTTFYDNIGNFFRNGVTTQHDINVSGGNEGLVYYFNAGYVKQSGVIPSSGYERLVLNLTTTATISKKSKLTTTANYTNSNVDKTTKGIGGYYLTILTWPIDNDMRNYINSNGTRRFLLSTTTTGTNEYDNPFWDVNKNEAEDRTNRLRGNITYAYDPAKWLNFTAITSVDNYTTQGFQITHPFSRYGIATNGYYSTYEQTFRQLTGNIRTVIRKNFAKNTIRNTLTVGFYFEDNHRVVDAQKGERFIEPNFASINNTEPLTRDASHQVTDSRKARLYSQYQFNWKDIIIPTFSLSYEGNSVLNSRFVDKDPHYTFGAFSLAFNIGEFEALKKTKIIDLMKLRTSYSTSGQTAGLLPYQIDPRFQGVTTTGGGYSYAFTGNNFNLQPQFTKSFEVGAEGSFFKKRLGFNITWYRNKTTDQIFFPRVSYGTGFVLKYFNGGDVENRGWEIQLTGSPIRTKNWGWDIVANFDRFRNKVLKLNSGPGGYYDSDTWVYGNLRSQTSVGQSIYSLWGTAFAYNNGGKLLINPATGLGVTTAALGQLFVPVGDRAPDFSVGIQNTITFKEFSMTFNLDMRRGGDVFNGTELALYRNGLSKRSLDREKPRIIEGVFRDGLENTATPTPNNIVIIPFYRNDYYQSTTSTTAGIVEGDFVEKDINWIRMRDMTLRYAFSNGLTKKLRIRTASFFITVTDLFLITNYNGADPSINTNNAALGGIGGIGIDYGSVSTPRAFSTGFRFSW
jgi:TonB-linked SusC/RagA family outer membrane protein